MSNEIRKTYYERQQTGDRLRVLLDMFKTQNAWEQFGYTNWETYCEKRLNTRAVEIDTEARSRVAEMAETAHPQNGKGRPIGTVKDDENKDYNYNTYNQNVKLQGTSQTYLTARIARDRPDILDRMKAGEYASVRGAAIDAGIIDPGKAPFQVPKDPAKAGRFLAKRVDANWFVACYKAFLEAQAE